MSAHRDSSLRARRLGIDTYQEPIVFMRADCVICRSEGFTALARVRLTIDNHSLIATVNVVHSDILLDHEAGLSEAAWHALAAREGALLRVDHPEPVESFSQVRGKIYQQRFSAQGLRAIIQDMRAGRYSGLQMAAFLTACGGDRLDLDETEALTRAMVEAGETLRWDAAPVVDKHCVGGLPGNRTTPIIVAIVTAAGLVMPKTSSRAITSPAGTADMMETLAPVALTLAQMRRVVEQEGGCIVWGGAMQLAPVDDLLIQVERPLDFDSDGQLAASMLSKKLAAGSSHVVIDMPVGPTAKLRDNAAARNLSRRLIEVGSRLGLAVRTVCSDGRQPVGRGLGPTAEAEDVLAVLRGTADAPPDLYARAVTLAGAVLELGAAAQPGEGEALASRLLNSGAAWRKFQAICEAQGGLRKPHRAAHQVDILAREPGIITAIHNRLLARVAKLAGAPQAPAAGLILRARCNEQVERGQVLYTIRAEAHGQLDYARNFAAAHPGIFQIEAPA